ncbi:MAG: hypothetical protein ABR537_03040 [Gemmatimonadales bacterium]|nr:hypothetical protein [Myxococcales bacterium]
MSETTGSATSPLMTQVIGSSRGGNGGDELLGEIESSGLSVGWNRATLSRPARDALEAILERTGGVMDRGFELRHGTLVLLRCRMLPSATRSELTFDGSQRRRGP